MKWILPAKKIKKEELIDYILDKRNISDKEKFINPQLEHIHSPLLLHDIRNAAEIIMDAVKNKKKIFIHGDFDVDGITATSIMWDFLFRKLNANVLPFIPDRFSEGYGLSDDSVQSIIDQGGELIITVDCGVKDIEKIKKYSDKIDFVITDHHALLAKSEVPKDLFSSVKYIDEYAISKDAKAVVHPKLGGKYPFSEICGSVVSWKVCSAINEIYNFGFNMNQYLDLAALGTVCDIMPLIGENRAIVKYGILRLNETENLGLKSLLEISGVNLGEVKNYHLGYIIGPRLNAAGRLKHAIDAVRLLSTENEKQAFKIATSLNSLNVERQLLTTKYFLEAEEQIKKNINAKVFFVYGDEWPEGIVGLIAGKLSQQYNRPALVGSSDGERIKGSARSIENFNIADAFKTLNEHLVRHGGHSQAAGFTLLCSNADTFTTELEKIVETSIGTEEIEESLKIDVILDLLDLDIDIIDILKNLEPFGQHNRDPIFALYNLKVKNIFRFGKNNEHIKFICSYNDKIVEVLAFNKAEYYSTLVNIGSIVDIAGYLEENIWNNQRKLQIRLLDLVPSI